MEKIDTNVAKLVFYVNLDGVSHETVVSLQDELSDKTGYPCVLLDTCFRDNELPAQSKERFDYIRDLEKMLQKEREETSRYRADNCRQYLRGARTALIASAVGYFFGAVITMLLRLL